MKKKKTWDLWTKYAIIDEENVIISTKFYFYFNCSVLQAESYKEAFSLCAYYFFSLTQEWMHQQNVISSVRIAYYDQIFAWSNVIFLAEFVNIIHKQNIIQEIWSTLYVTNTCFPSDLFSHVIVEILMTKHK